ncbi:MAG: hypothetical protein FWD53_00320 [Phycisphaerales bacterium]|nr:hypothetical protein [Phycisphaerales bacterium]
MKSVLKTLTPKTLALKLVVYIWLMWAILANVYFAAKSLSFVAAHVPLKEGNDEKESFKVSARKGQRSLPAATEIVKNANLT